MALMRCPECEKEISSKAAACPSCGHPIAPVKQAPPNTIWTTPSASFGCLTVIGVIIILIMLIMIAGLSEGAEPEYPPAITVRCTWVIDGDTIKIRTAGGKIESVRLIGVNTPERGEEGFKAARDFVIEHCHEKDVRVEFDKTERDKYRRLLGYIFAPGQGGDEIFINAELLRAGLAKPYGYFSSNRYDQILEDAACKE